MLQPIDDDLDVTIRDSRKEISCVGIVKLLRMVQIPYCFEISPAEILSELVSLSLMISNPSKIAYQLELSIYPGPCLCYHRNQLIVASRTNQILSVGIVLL